MGRPFLDYEELVETCGTGRSKQNAWLLTTTDDRTPTKCLIGCSLWRVFTLLLGDEPSTALTRHSLYHLVSLEWTCTWPLVKSSAGVNKKQQEATRSKGHRY